MVLIGTDKSTATFYNMHKKQKNNKNNFARLDHIAFSFVILHIHLAKCYRETFFSLFGIVTESGSMSWKQPLEAPEACEKKKIKIREVTEIKKLKVAKKKKLKKEKREIDRRLFSVR